jgi:hypothetical protein
MKMCLYFTNIMRFIFVVSYVTLGIHFVEICISCGSFSCYCQCILIVHDV